VRGVSCELGTRLQRLRQQCRCADSSILSHGTAQSGRFHAVFGAHGLNPVVFRIQQPRSRNHSQNACRKTVSCGANAWLTLKSAKSAQRSRAFCTAPIKTLIGSVTMKLIVTAGRSRYLGIKRLLHDFVSRTCSPSCTLPRVAVSPGVIRQTPPRNPSGVSLTTRFRATLKRVRPRRGDYHCPRFEFDRKKRNMM